MTSFRLKTLVAAVAAFSLNSQLVHSAPAGGVVVDGSGTISQAGVDTRIDQMSERLSLEWDSFNVAASERVQFVQPGADAIALNRILDNNGSQILGRIDANGQVILMNPNGVFFGRDAVVNVGGLVASGLNINSDDFMNGDLVFSGLDGSAGTVVNQGIINAASGGNVALLGKNVVNKGLISAELGHVALAAGSEAVVTFDDAGLLGVRIDAATLASEVGSAYAVSNSGEITASGGKILLNASVSADLFSEAVNHGDMGGSDLVFHDDGSFTIGGGNSVMNTGTLDASVGATADYAAGEVILAGENLEQRGTLRANGTAGQKAGAVYLEAHNQARMTASSRIEANGGDSSGKVSIDADSVASVSGAAVATTGNAYVRGYLDVRTPDLTANNLKLTGLGSVTQAAAAEVAGVTQVATTAGGDIRLTHGGNDFNVVSVDAGYDDYVAIVDRNDLVLGDVRMEDSSLRIESLGGGASISQLPGSALSVSGGTLRLSADNILLGEAGATTRLAGVSFLADFGQRMATNGSVTLLPYNGFYVNSARIRAMDRQYGDVYLDLRGNRAIDLNAELDANNLRLDLHGMKGSSATLSGYMETYQTAPIHLTGTLTWNSYMATLTHEGNDIATLQGSGGPAFGGLDYVDSNDLLLRNLVTEAEVSLKIRSHGEGFTVRQVDDTKIVADFVELAGDNLVLGANGRSSVNAGYALQLRFRDTLILNGPWGMGGWYAPVFIIHGDDSDNRLVFGQFATNDSFAGDGLMGNIDIQLMGGNDTVIFDSPFLVGDAAYYGVNQLDMGDGNDRVYYNQSVYIPLILGPGEDLLRVWDLATHYEVLDLDVAEDRLLIAHP